MIDDWSLLVLYTSITGSMNMNLSKPWEIVKDSKAWSATVHRVEKSWTQLSNRTTTTVPFTFCTFET